MCRSQTRCVWRVEQASQQARQFGKDVLGLGHGHGIGADRATHALEGIKSSAGASGALSLRGMRQAFSRKKSRVPDRSGTCGKSDTRPQTGVRRESPSRHKCVEPDNGLESADPGRGRLVSAGIPRAGRRFGRKLGARVSRHRRRPASATDRSSTSQRANGRQEAS